MFEFLSEHGTDIVAIIIAAMYLFKLVANMTPGVADDGVFKKLDDIFDALIPNYKLPDEEKENGESSK